MILLLPSALAERYRSELEQFAERIPMEISDAQVDGYFSLAEKVDRRCPDCRCFLTVDPETEETVCPKCGWKEK